MLVSICIPCYKRLAQVRNTLRSIFELNAEVSISDYEVVITDNDSETELRAIIDEYAQYPNLRYIPTQCEGFLNSYQALKNGRGNLLKLHNSQNMIRKGMLSEIINQAKQNLKQRPLIFHSNGFLEHHQLVHYSDFNSFMDGLSYWSSWSGGMTIWRDDFERIGDIEINPLFPHTSVFLTQYFKKDYIIDDRIMYDVQRVSKRGGHNKFEAFTVHYPSLVVKNCESGHISELCKNNILKALYTEYIPTLLFNKYIARIETFDSTGFRTNCKQYFPKGAFWGAWINVLFVPFRMSKRRIRQWLSSIYQKTSY